MPIGKVLRAFAEENFEDRHYFPVSHGETTLIKPLALVVKRPRSIFKRPFAKSEFIVIGDLEDYLEKEKREEFTEITNSAILKEEKLEMKNKEGDEEIEASRYVFVKVEAGRYVKVNVEAKDELGELELGKLDQEYFKDPDLREILAKTVLDANRMEGLEEQELRLIYSVIYSERFLLNGKRKHEKDVGINVALPESVAEFLPQLKGTYKKRTTPPKAATRNKRGPILFKLVCVNYDKEKRRLNIPQNEFSGKHFFQSMHACIQSVEWDIKERDNEEYTETIIGMEKEDIDMSDEDVKKLEIIKKAVLISTENREERKERVKKYLNWFEEALLRGQKKVSLFEPLTNEDREFLRSIHCPALPNQPSVDLESLDEEKIQGYAIVLKQIDDLSDKHWDEIEKAWAQAEQNE